MTPFLRTAIAEMLPGAGDGGACADCGFVWATDRDVALAHLDGAAGRFADLLDGREARPAPAPGWWSPSGYVWHVADVTRAWAERLHSLAAQPEARWAPFDPDELARARHYDELPASTGPWALARSVEALHDGLALHDHHATFLHPEWGRGTVTDALRWLAHEVVHHELDVRRGDGGSVSSS